MTRSIFFILSSNVLLLLQLISGATAQISDSQGVSALFSLPEEAAAFNSQSRMLSLLMVKDGVLQERASIPIEGNVWQVTASPTRYLIATGMGKSALDAPIRVISVTRELRDPQEVFSFASERAEVPFLKWIDAKGAPAKVWLSFFDSKYTTRIGYLSPSSDTPWSFNELDSIRMGTAVDVAGDGVIVGRPYGDVQGQDGDLLLLRDKNRELLPSYRGVRATRVVGDPQDPVIFIGDGWHQNYGQMAQGRVSLVRKDPSTGRYALQILDKDNAQYGFSKFVDFMINAKRYVAALGPKQIIVYGPEGLWNRNVLYSRDEEDSLMDMALAKRDADRVWFVVADKGLRLVSFPG